MRIFIKNIVIFSIIGLLFGECVARIFHLTTDIPSRYIDEDQIQKYKPNQGGSWVGGSHTWQINDTGWPGEAPTSYDNLITIIGDSYIENFMNPDSCHQASYLRKMLPEYNYLEAARSGVSFIESVEIAKQLDSLTPVKQLIYVHDGDFLESIVQITKMGDITQFDLEKEEVVPGTLKSPFLKKILYNWKFMYYLYTNYAFGDNSNNEVHIETKNINKGLQPEKLKKMDAMLSYVKNNYDLKNVVFILRPNMDPGIVSLLKKHQMEFHELKMPEDSNWSFEYDAHWTCLGHLEAAKQVINYLQ